MSLMLEESLEAPERVAGQLARDADLYAALGERLRRAPPPGALTIARGSSDNAAAYGAYLLTLLAGLPVASLPPSLVTLERARLAVDGHLALAVSQSGRSPDIVACLEAARQAGAVAVAVVNDPASPLADAADTVLPQHAGPERSVAATKSFITSLTAIARLAVAWRPDPALAADLERLPDRLRAPPSSALPPTRAGPTAPGTSTCWPRRGPAGRPGGGAQAQGDLRPARRGLQLRRAAPRAARDRRRPLRRARPGARGSRPR